MLFPVGNARSRRVKKGSQIAPDADQHNNSPRVPELNVLEEIGVARVSLGPSFLKIAIKAMKNLATKLQKHDGLKDIVENEITSDYLRKLLNKK